MNALVRAVSTGFCMPPLGPREVGGEPRIAGKKGVADDGGNGFRPVSERGVVIQAIL